MTNLLLTIFVAFLIQFILAEGETQASIGNNPVETIQIMENPR